MHFKVTILLKRRVNNVQIQILESQVWKTINQINTNKKSEWLYQYNKIYTFRQKTLQDISGKWHRMSFENDNHNSKFVCC